MQVPKSFLLLNIPPGVLTSTSIDNDNQFNLGKTDHDSLCVIKITIGLLSVFSPMNHLTTYNLFVSRLPTADRVFKWPL